MFTVIEGEGVELESVIGDFVLFFCSIISVCD